jgi:hypothetical protein
MKYKTFIVKKFLAVRASFGDFQMAFEQLKLSLDLHGVCSSYILTTLNAPVAVITIKTVTGFGNLHLL